MGMDVKTLLLALVVGIFFGANFSLLQTDLSIEGCACNNHNATDLERRVDTVHSDISETILAQPSLSEEPLPSEHKHPICAAIRDTSTTAFWTKHLRQIWQSSRHDADDDKHQFYAYLLSWIAPRLSLSVKSVPRPDGVQDLVLPHMMNKAWKRYEYLKHGGKEDANAPPPIQITVLGGSVARGKGCDKSGGPAKACAWPKRLENFLNKFFGIPLIRVSNLALGGTVTPISTYILQQQRLLEHHPDIIINAHASNDQNAFNILDKVTQQATSLTDEIFAMLQDFTRMALTMNDCVDNTPPPLVLHLNDYIGNLNPTLLETFATPQAVAMVSGYYGTAAAAFADVVRDWVYGDTTERLFTSPWYAPHKKRDPVANKMNVDVHPPEFMHVVSAWIIAYQFLTYATVVCGQEQYYFNPESFDDPFAYNPERFLPDVLPAYNDTSAIDKYIQDKAESPPKGLPPLLTKDSKMNEITAQWRKAAENKECPTTSENRNSKNHCLFGWLTRTWPVTESMDDIRDLFRNPSTFNNWKFVSDNGKIGWVPPGTTTNTMKSMILEFANIPANVSHVDYFFMKSFGPDWASSVVNVDVYKRPHGSTNASWGSPVATHRLEGFHHSTATSVMFPEVFAAEVTSGHDLRLNMTLVSGVKFKLMGLFVC